MEIIRQASEDEMVLEFLKAEINTINSGQRNIQNAINSELQRLGKDKKIITEGTIFDGQNETRSEILGNSRGYKKNKMLFRNFPSIRQWDFVNLGGRDFEKLKYINLEKWIKLSNGTRYVVEAAKKIQINKNNEYNEFIKGTEFIRNGGKFRPPIILTDEKEEELIILEGHNRLTIYMLVLDKEKKIEAFVGRCRNEELTKWEWK